MRIPCGILKTRTARRRGHKLHYPTPAARDNNWTRDSFHCTRVCVSVNSVCVRVNAPGLPMYWCTYLPIYKYNNIICNFWQRWRPRVCINIRVFRTMVTQQSKTLCRRPPYIHVLMFSYIYIEFIHTHTHTYRTHANTRALRPIVINGMDMKYVFR